MSAEIRHRLPYLEHFLGEYGISVDKWGRNGKRSIEDLATEEVNGETTFHVEQGRLFRRIRVAGINVYCIESDRIYKLHEDRQIFADNTERVRYLPQSLSEKIQKDEAPQQAAIRGLKEELGFTDEAITQSDLHFVNQKEDEGESKGYKGLLTKTGLFIYDILIDKDNPSYNDSYEEKQPNKTTYFSWRRM